MLLIEDVYNNFIHDHKIYKTTTGQIRNLYKSNGTIIKSAQAAKYLRFSKWLQGLGILGSVLESFEAFQKIRSGKGEFIDYIDGTIGVIGLTESGASLYGLGVPIVGERVALYGCVRLGWDMGEKFGPSTWWGNPNVWWGYKLGF